ncbi:MAG: branched-chain amino acid ABC transporter ATP-binding protein/permease [Desulfitobacteriaceae bacterium]
MNMLKGNEKHRMPARGPAQKALSLSVLVPLFALLVAALFPLVFNLSGYVLSLVLLAMCYTIVVVGLNILLGYTGQLSLGQGAFFGIGAYAFAILSASHGLSFWIGFLAGIIVPVLFGFVIGLTTSKLSGHYLAMVTISFQMIVSLVLNNWKVLTNGPDGITDIPRPSLFGLINFKNDLNFYYFSLFFVILVLLFAYRLKYSRLGRAMAAVRENEMAAGVTGVRVYRAKVMAFVLASGMAGLGGVLYAAGSNYISPDPFSFAQSVVFLTMSLVGGSGSAYGGLLGAVLLTFLPEWLRFLKEIYIAVYGFMVILAVLFLPKGIWGLTQVLEKYFRKSQEVEALELKEFLPKPEFASDMMSVKGLSKHFGGLKAVDRVDFTVTCGEIKALIGPNGSGKTTILNLLSGLYIPTGGKILFDSQEIGGRRPEDIAALGIARTFQNIRLFGDLSVIENVMVGQTCRTKEGLLSVAVPNQQARKERNLIRSKAMATLKFVGLQDKADWSAKNLPYGQQRLVEIARALATEPKLLLLDEPAAGLNASETDELVNLLKKLNRMGLSMLLVEHDMSLVKSLATTVTVLNFGQKISEGTTEHTLQDPLVVEAYLGKEEEAYA